MNTFKGKKQKIIFKDLRTSKPSSALSEYKLSLNDIEEYGDLQSAVKDRIKSDNFVICMSTRDVINEKNFHKIVADDTLWILESPNQPLTTQVDDYVNIAPHPDTITQSGMHEYYSSRGINPVVISIAELIDNSLAATASNEDIRKIEICVYFDDANTIMFIKDNGCGMDTEGLKAWAKFKYSKHVRVRRSFNDSDGTFSHSSSPQSVFNDTGYGSQLNESFTSDSLPLNGPLTPQSTSINDETHHLRYLNSNINFFGAGGKQAIFCIGKNTTMTTKMKNKPDIHMMTLSEYEFNKKQRENPDDVYKVNVTSKKIGTLNDDLLNESGNSAEVIKRVNDELEKESNFTCCCIKEITPENVKHLKDNFELWTRNLAHIYHYYLHGPNGNTKIPDEDIPEYCKNLSIIVRTFNVFKVSGTVHIEQKKCINLRSEINDDPETQLVQSSKSTFEFIIKVPSKNDIEGVVRYHPYLYDRETFPNIEDNGLGERDETASQSSRNSKRRRVNNSSQDDDNDDDDNEIEEITDDAIARGNKPIFECFWNGRLIPGTSISHLQWCEKPQRDSKVPPECYYRVSGALFTDQSYRVTQNKQTFTDLHEHLNPSSKKVSYSKVDNESIGQRRIVRTPKFETEFIKWLGECHTKYDKQVKYTKFQGVIKRADLIKSCKMPTKHDQLAMYEQIEWHGMVYKKGNKIKTKGTRPANVIGEILRFYAPGTSENDPYHGSAGFVEITLLPAAIFGSTIDARKIYHFSKINVEAEEKDIIEEITDNLRKLPCHISIEFRDRKNSMKEYPIYDGEEIPAGRPIGNLQIFVRDAFKTNLKGKLQLRYSRKNVILSAQFLIISDDGTETAVHEYEYCNYSQKWNYWFWGLKNGFEQIGSYVLRCRAMIMGDNGEKDDTFADGTPLPIKEIRFKVLPGPAQSFKISNEVIHVNVGVPFDVPILFYDKYGNRSEATINIDLSLCIDDYIVEYGHIEAEDNCAVIKGIKILGNVRSSVKVLKLKICISQFDTKAHILPINLRSGEPNKLLVIKRDESFENGSLPKFEVIVHDVSDNVIHADPNKFTVICNFTQRYRNRHVPIGQTYVLEEENGRFTLKGEPIIITDFDDDTVTITAKFRVNNYPNVTEVEKNVTMKRNWRPSKFVLFCDNPNNKNKALKMNEKINWIAGESLTGVTFKVYDANNSLINPLNLDPDKLLNISWCEITDNVKLNFKSGILPDIKVPPSAKQTLRHTLIYQHTENENNIILQHPFNIYTISGQPSVMTIKPIDSPLIFNIGVKSDLKIAIYIYDKNNNLIELNTSLLLNVDVNADSEVFKIEDEQLIKDLQSYTGASLIVSGIKLMPKSNERMNLRSKVKIVVKYYNAKGEFDVNVASGIPKSLKWGHGSHSDEFLSVTNNTAIQLKVQMFDMFNNESRFKDIEATLSLGSCFKNKIFNVLTDDHGSAVFPNVLLKIDTEPRRQCQIPSDLPETLKNNRNITQCRTLCHGFTKIFSEVNYKGHVIKSKACYLHVKCDSKTPKKFEIYHNGSLIVTSKSNEMPLMIVKVLAEDDSCVRAVSSQKLFMHLLCSDGTVLEFSPNDNSNNGVVHFKPDLTPLIPDIYRFKFIYRDNNETFSKIYVKNESGRPPYELNVIPAPPDHIEVLSNSIDGYNDLKVVSNTESEQSRSLLHNNRLELGIMDKHGNIVSKNNQQLERNPNLEGSMRVEIVNCNDEDHHEIPELERIDAQFTINMGKCLIQNLQLKCNSKGKDGEQYKVRFTAELKNRELRVRPFEYRILFCDDVQKQNILKNIQNEIFTLNTNKKDINDELLVYESYRTEQSDEVKERTEIEQTIRRQLTEIGETSDLITDEDIRQRIEFHDFQVNNLKIEQSNRPIRGFKLSKAPIESGIFGRIAHLATIEDEKSAIIISWFLRQYMSSIVTETTQIALDLHIRNDDYDITYPLDTIRRKDLPSEWNDELPHVKHNVHIEFDDKVKYARTVLEFTTENDVKCYEVFGALLGDTLLMDTLENALNYRQKLIEVAPCPTILTKTFQILHHNGVIDRGSPNDIKTYTQSAFQAPPFKQLTDALKKSQLLNQLIVAINNKIESEDHFSLWSEKASEIINQRETEMRNLNEKIIRLESEFLLQTRDRDNLFRNDSHAFSQNFTPSQTKCQYTPSLDSYDESVSSSKRARY